MRVFCTALRDAAPAFAGWMYISTSPGPARVWLCSPHWPTAAAACSRRRRDARPPVGRTTGSPETQAVGPRRNVHARVVVWTRCRPDMYRGGRSFIQTAVQGGSMRRRVLHLAVIAAAAFATGLPVFAQQA